jgi:hypothetical protein
MFHLLYYLANNGLDQFDVLIHLESEDKLNNVEVHWMAKFELYHYHKE